MKKASVITLGCSKNLVDSEQLMYQLQENGYEIEHNGAYQGKDIVLVNTCGFIQDAKQESIDLMMDLIEAKKNKEIKDIRIFGCLSERYKEELESEIPEIKYFYGTYELNKIYTDLGIQATQNHKERRFVSTPNHYAYVKISDGCNRTCSFCAIPLIKGKHRSRPEESILAECRYLAQKGVKEIILIAQDLSFYGLDTHKQSRLVSLIQKISAIPEIKWIRTHYLYPAQFPYDLIDEMKRNPKLCRYIDLALQHISDNQLKTMRRNINKQKTLDLIDKIKSTVPDVALRTTMLVGHPNETEQDFEELLEFVNQTAFDRLGGFTYSSEDNTFAKDHYEDNVPEDIKAERFNRMMDLQQEISFNLNQQKINQVYTVIIDREEEDYYIGRTEFDSPEVDNEVLISKNQQLNIGEFYSVKIQSADSFDIIGDIYED